MRIALTTQCFPPDLGGVETYMGDVARHLGALGHEVHVFADQSKAASPTGDPQADPHVHIRRYGGPRPIRRRIKAFRVRQFLTHHRDAIILADTWKSVEALKTAGHAVFIFAHGNDVVAEQGTAKFERIRKALQKADKIIANSQFTARLVSMFGIAPERIILFPIPVTPQPEPHVAALGEVDAMLAGQHPVLVTLARLEPRKGVDRVIALMPKLAEQYPNLRYLVAGGGNDRARLEALAAQSGVSHAVHFTGRVNDTMKAAILTRADLFVMPTRREGRSVEGFGISFMEAAWYGVPAVTTDSGGTADAVIDQRTGFVCPTDDADALYRAIDALLSSETLRRQFGDQARTRARTELNWQTGIQRLATVLSNGVASHP